MKCSEWSNTATWGKSQLVIREQPDLLRSLEILGTRPVDAGGRCFPC